MSLYIELAKSAVENYIKERKITKAPKNIPEEIFSKRAGVFVTIEKNGQLRGCIGTYLPIKKNIAEEIIHNAIAAATEDYRFTPIQKEELPDLSYVVYILNEPEFVKDTKKLNPKKYGIIVKTLPIVSPNGSTGSPQEKTDVIFNGHLPIKTGLLLPGLDGVDTIEQQFSIACQKGGIDPQKEKVLIYSFTVEKYDE